MIVFISGAASELIMDNARLVMRPEPLCRFLRVRIRLRRGRGARRYDMYIFFCMLGK